MINIIFQDDDIALINKPAGLVVNRAESVKVETLQDEWEKQIENFQLSIENWGKLLPEDFSDEYGSPEEIFASRSGIVHRLDKDTSGIMVLAKNPGALINLLSQFKQRQVKKSYMALVHGQIKDTELMIDMPMARSKANPHKFTQDQGGRGAVTKVVVKQRFVGLKNELVDSFDKQVKQFYKNTNQGFTLVECFPQTGRTHQIRVHLSQSGYPLVSDSIYLGRKWQRMDEKWCSRHFLHALELEFTHPRNKERVSYQAELSSDLTNALKYLITGS